MHSAPSVSYPVGRSRNARLLLLAIWVAGCAAALAWWLQSGSAAGVWRGWVMLAALAVASVATWRGLSAVAPGELRWDGQHWWVAGAPQPATDITVHLDLQSLLLLRLRAPGRPAHWLWPERRACPERWRDLRRAVYSRAPATPEAADGHPTSYVP